MVDLAILCAFFQCGKTSSLLKLFQTTFTVSMLHYISRTQSGIYKPQAILHAAAIWQRYNTTMIELSLPSDCQARLASYSVAHATQRDWQQ